MPAVSNGLLKPRPWWLGAMDEIGRIARQHKLPVIEDAAHALGASYHGRRVGHLGSLVTTLSFHPVKSITTGEGGMVMTDSRRLDQQLRLWRSHGVIKNTQGKNIMTALGYNYRMCDLQAALGRSQMARLDAFMAARRRAVRWYRQALASIPEITRPVELPLIRSAWHLYIIQVKDPRQRDALRRHLTKAGIGANYHYPAVYDHPYYRRHGYRRTALPVTDHYSATTITLPLHTLLRQRDVRFVADTIRQFFHS